jgi:hypothetical protein
MNFEVQHALASLDSRTPDFFIREALADANPKTREAAKKILSSFADDLSACARLREMLRLV